MFESRISSLLENSNFLLSQAHILANQYLEGEAESQQSLEDQEKMAKIFEENAKIMQQLDQSVKALGISSPLLKGFSSMIQTGSSMSAKAAKEFSEHIKKEKSELKIKLIISDKKGTPLSEITDQDVEKYYLELQEELIRDWKTDRPRRATKGARGKSRRKGNGKRQAQQKVGHSKPKSQQTESEKPLPPVSGPASSSSAMSKAEQIGQFIQSLLVIQSPVKEIPRVTRRWEKATNAEIRDFIDNQDGQLVKRYERLSEEEINKQRARHLLPGIDRLLMNESFKKIYTFPTSRGCGMFATLNYGPFSERGIVYVGISGGDTIFHKYFEPFSSAISSGNLTLDPTNAEQADEPGEEWVHTLPFDPSVDGEGQITLRFHKELHFITIEPVRTDLLNPKLFNCN